jgi:mRNA deadenylase 3'-5' endonuclease subunit Ccr4
MNYLFQTNSSDDQGERLWICNTHLNWNNTLPATQLFQIRTLLAELTRLNKETHDGPFVIVGDFNSTRDSIVHDYIRNGFLTDTAEYYSKVRDIYLPLFNGDSTKTTEYLAESHKYKKTLESAYNKNTFLMPFTTRIVNHFCGTIDYIYYQHDRLRPLQLLNPLYDDGERATQDDFTLPNEQHPSDHLPLMTELALLPPSTANDATNVSKT